MTSLLLIVIGFLLYSVLALLLLRFMKFLTVCDREIRVMTKGREHHRPIIFKSAKKARRILALRPLSA